MIPGSLDIVIPTYNAEATIEQAIRSVQAQKDLPLQILVVDDQSDDRSAEIVSSLLRDDPRIRLLRVPHGGIVAALNHGLARAEAEFVARLDADDLAAPDRFSRQIAFLRANPDVVAVSGAHREIDIDGRATGRIFRPLPPEDLDPASLPAREPQLTQPFMMARNSVLRRIGGYRPFPVSEDSDLYWRMLEHGRLANLDEIVGSYRIHAGSISSRSIRNGRLMAVCSQFSALSAQRRLAGRPDVVPFVSSIRDAPCDSMTALLTAASQDLDSEEVRWLRAASAAKLMELSGYRPYELEPSDYRFISSALDDLPPIDDANLRELRKMRAATAARAVRQGRFSDATAVACPSLWPQIALRAGTGRLYWRKHLTATKSSVE